MPGVSSSAALSDRFHAALQLAWQVHGTQLRKQTRIPYMAHVMSVGALAMENGADEDVAIAALLHDAVEDSHDGAATEQDIRRRFGPRVADIVLTCSDAIGRPDGHKADWRERKQTYLTHLRDADDDALLVSLCDKLHNVRSVLNDLGEVGTALWQRFTVKDPEQQLWYYESLAAVFSEKFPGRLATAFADDVQRLRAAVEQQAADQPKSDALSRSSSPG